MKNMARITKKKTGAAILCGALLLSMGTTSTFAASPTDSDLVKFQNEVKSFDADGGQQWRGMILNGMPVFHSEDGKVRVSNDIVPEEATGMRVLVKSQDGVKQYSMDDGETWSETVPAGMPALGGKDRKFLVQNGEALKDGLGIKVKIEDGVKLFSTDDGQTWSEEIPEGLRTFHGKKDFGIKGMFQTVDGVAVQVKIENGVKQYSTDGGETWGETTPEGMPALDGKDRKFVLKNGEELKDRQDVMVKVEDGVRSISADGGQTWSEKTLEGAPLKLHERF